MSVAILVILILILCTLVLQYKRRMEESERRNLALLALSTDAIVILSDLKIRFANHQAIQLFDAQDESDLIGRYIFELYDEQYLHLAKERIDEIYYTKQSVSRIEQRLISLSGEPLIVDIASVYLSYRGKPAIQMVIRDLTLKKQSITQLHDSDENNRNVMDLLPDAIVVHSEGKIAFCNEKAADLLGVPHPSDLIGCTGIEYVDEEFRDLAYRGIQKLYSEMESLSLAQSKLVCKDGKTIDIEISAIWIRYNGKPSILMILRDITLRKLEESQLKESKEKYKLLSHLDGLTGLKNRRYFDKVFLEYWQRAFNQSSPLSLILFDIDYFKAFNDNYGHQDGDECLKQVAAAVESVLVLPDEFVARYGGEEFAIVLPRTPHAEAMELAHLIRTTVEDLQIPHPHSSVSDHVTLSVGVSTAVPDLRLSPSELIESADKALYEAKVKGRNLVAVNTL